MIIYLDIACWKSS